MNKLKNEELRWSYFNVLKMLIASVPEGTYTPDFGRWTKVIKDLQQKYENKYPELFDDIYFIEHEPLNPYSPEIEEFFQRIGIIVYNPNFETMDITTLLSQIQC